MIDIISITTVPWRIEKFDAVLTCLLNQQYITPYKIVITICKQNFKDWRSEFTKESVKLINDNNIKVIVMKDDLNVYKRYQPLLQNNNIIIADDDILYNETWLKQFQLTHAQYPDDIIVNTTRGKFNKFYYNRELLCAPIESNTVNLQYGKQLTVERFRANGGIYIPANILQKEFFDYELIKKNCATDDEIWLIANALHSNVKLRFVMSKAPFKYAYETNNFHDKALCNTNTKEQFYDYVANLRKLYPEFNEFVLQFAV